MIANCTAFGNANATAPSACPVNEVFWGKQCAWEQDCVPDLNVSSCATELGHTGCARLDRSDRVLCGAGPDNYEPKDAQMARYAQTFAAHTEPFQALSSSA